MFASAATSIGSSMLLKRASTLPVASAEQSMPRDRLIYGSYLSVDGEVVSMNCLVTREIQARDTLFAVIKFGNQHHAFLLVRIGAGNDCYTVIYIAQIVGQMRYIGGDIDKVAGLGNEMVFQFLAEPHAGFAAESVNRGFVTCVLMSLAPCAGRDGCNLQIDPACTLIELRPRARTRAHFCQ